MNALLVRPLDQRLPVPHIHVAIVTAAIARRLADGTKRIETRFYRCKRQPYNKIRTGDTIHFKLSGGGLIGTACARHVLHLTGLNPAGIRHLRRTLNHAISAPAHYWRDRHACRYGVLIWLGELAPPPSGLCVPRQYGTGWVMLDRRQVVAARGRGRPR